MCIVVGCDYLKNMRGIGIKRVKEIVIQDEFLDKMIGFVNCLVNYVIDFR